MAVNFGSVSGLRIVDHKLDKTISLRNSSNGIGGFWKMTTLEDSEVTSTSIAAVTLSSAIDDCDETRRERAST
ncbi:hypothetical protein RB195_026498 [Necator americanus]